MHIDSGPLTLDLSNPTDGNTVQTAGGALSTPLLPFQKMIVAHAILCTVGFLILLPAGALLARYARTFTGAWFKGHWIFQFALGMAVIVRVSGGHALINCRVFPLQPALSS